MTDTSNFYGGPAHLAPTFTLDRSAEGHWRVTETSHTGIVALYNFYPKQGLMSYRTHPSSDWSLCAEMANDDRFATRVRAGLNDGTINQDDAMMALIDHGHHIVAKARQ